MPITKNFIFTGIGILGVVITITVVLGSRIEIILGNALAGALFIGLAQICNGNPAPCSKYLFLSMQHQDQTEWCWAATTVSISRFYNPTSTWTQCNLANTYLGHSSCCQHPTPPVCNQGGWPEAALSITGNWSSSTGGSEPLSTIINEINGGRPISIIIWWGSGGSHSVVIDGYDNCDSNNPMIDIKDPWYGPSTVYFNNFPTHYLNNINGGASWGNSYLTK